MSTNVTAPDLTHTERRVLLLVSQGYSCKEIAVALNICCETVKKHRKNISRKLGGVVKRPFGRLSVS